MGKPSNSRQNINPAKQLKQTKVPTGISLLFASLALTTLSLILLIIAPFTGNSGLIAVVVFGVLIAFVLAQLMAVVGKLLCLTAPKEMAGRATIYISVIFDLISISINVLNRISTLPKIVSDLQTMIAAIAYVSFLLFLKQVAEFIHKNNLAKDAEGILLIGIGLIVTLGLATIFPILALLTLLFFLIGVIRYYKLLMNLSEAMQSL
ncbi:MAG: hypothetical protein DCF20_12935 [Pseudanabaena sp.]|nr:MAG: hypothetical protein DCF20_12935 [Pseudanabaena sp.]